MAKRNREVEKQEEEEEELLVSDNGNEEEGEEEVEVEEEEESGSKDGEFEVVGDRKYTLPSAEEQDHLRKTRNLFLTNLLKMEMDEVLKNSVVKFGEKKMAGMRKILVTLKETLEKLPEKKDVGSKSVKVKIINWEKTSPVLNFKPPVSVDVVGSFMLETMTKPTRTVDVAITIPSACFEADDYLNHRYTDKKLIYLGHLAKEISSLDIFDEVSFAPFLNDSFKPVLVIRPSVSTKLSKYSIRLLPVLEDDTFPLRRFHPNQGNVRILDHFPHHTLIKEKNVKTPHYNMRVLEDVASSSFRTHMELLHVLKAECPAFVDTCSLLKIWSRVHGLSKESSPDSFHENLLIFLLAYLILERHIHSTMSSQQMIRSLMSYIVSSKLLTSRRVLRLRTMIKATPVVHEAFSDEAFLGAFDICMIGPCGRLNLAWRVTKSEWSALENEARKTHSMLEKENQTGGKDVFASLFTAKVDVWQKFDKYFAVKVDPLPNDRNSKFPVHVPENVCNYGWEMFARREVERLFHRAFRDTQRAHNLRVIINSQELAERESSGDLRSKAFSILVCLQLDPSQTFRILDKGPSAEKVEAAAAFRAFYGENKSELRRFKDGTILETVDWTTDCSIGNLEPSEAIAKYILGTNWPFSLSNANTQPLVGKELELALSTLDKTSLEREKAVAIEKDPFKALIVAYGNLSSTLSSLDLPLSIVGTTPASSFLRYSSPTTPIQHPLAFGKGDRKRLEILNKLEETMHSKRGDGTNPPSQKRKKSTLTFSRLVDAVDVVVQVEASGKWPDDPSAIAHMKTAFYVQIANELEKHKSSHFQAIAARNCVEVLSSGYAFRLVLRIDKEISILKNALPRSFLGSVSRVAAQQMRENLMDSSIDGSSSRHANQILAFELERNLIRKPLLHLHLHGIHTRSDETGGAFTMGPVSRLAKLWVSGHGLWPHLQEEAIDLLVASLFLHPQPYEAPRSVSSGFLRFLHLLAFWDWENEPLMVNLNDDFDQQARGDVLKAFLQARDRRAGAPMFIITPQDKDADWTPYWTNQSMPSTFALDRMVQLAKDSIMLLEHLLGLQASHNYSEKSMSELWMSVFQSSPESSGYDLVLNLRKARTLEGMSTSGKVAAKLYKNLVSEEKVFVGVNPVDHFGQHVMEVFGHYCEVFYDPFRGAYLGIKWKDEFFKPVPLRVAVAGYAMPAPLLADSKEGKKKRTSTKRKEDHSDSDSDDSDMETAAKSKKSGLQVVPNVVEILSDLVEMSGGLVSSVNLKNADSQE